MAFHFDWFKGHFPLWGKLLKKFKNKPNLLFLEIGCFEGRATLWLCQNILTHPSSKIAVIDTFKGSMEHKKEDVKNLLTDFKENLRDYISSDPKKSKVIIYQETSAKALREFGVENQFDFVYIDSSLVAKDVLEDTILAWRLLKKGGMMVLNNYGWRVYKNPLLRADPAINAFMRIFEGRYKIVHVGYQVIITKKGDDIPISKMVRKNRKSTKRLPFLDELEQMQLNNERLNKNITKMHSDLVSLSGDLNKIHSAKFYRLWQEFCKLRRFLKNGQYK